MSNIMSIPNILIGLKIMGLGMLGVFTAMIVIMAVSYLLLKIDGTQETP